MSELQRLASHRTRIVGWLWATVAGLAIVHTGLQYVKFTTGHDHVFGLVRLFNLDGEANLPTLFSTLLLLSASMLLLCIGMHERRGNSPFATRWLLLATGFLFMAVDEAAMIHELFDSPTRRLMGDDASDAFLYAWVVPYTLLVVALLVYFIKFLLHLPAGTRARFCIAGAIYVAGALGLEFLEGVQAGAHGEASAGYMVLNTIQELMEMSGTIIFIDALLGYIVDHGVVAAPAAAGAR